MVLMAGEIQRYYPTEFGPKLEISLNNAASSERNPLTAENGMESPASDKGEPEKVTIISYLPGLSWVGVAMY